MRAKMANEQQLREALKNLLTAIQETPATDEAQAEQQNARISLAVLRAESLVSSWDAQQPATGVPVYWEWRHLSTHPDTVDFEKWSEWKRVEARSAIHTIEDALAEFRTYIAQGYKYELRALYTHPAPSVPGDDFDLICNAIDKADTITMEGDYMLDSDTTALPLCASCRRCYRCAPPCSQPSNA